MTSSQTDKPLGEKLQGKIDQSHANLASAWDSSSQGLTLAKSPLAIQTSAANAAICLRNVTDLSVARNCRQKICFSFFFDGTGNNLNGDYGKS